MKAANKPRRRIFWTFGVISICVILGAILWPGRPPRQHRENTARNFMETIVLSLNEYRTTKGTYPPSPDWCMEDWLSKGPAVFHCNFLANFKDAGPSAFSGGVPVLRYRYTYSAGDAEHFTLRALPNVRSAGWITYYADESGRIRHCIQQAGNETADGSDSEITTAPGPC